MAKPGRAGLGLWDRLVLLLAWGVTCGLVYLLGFYVGKGMQERPLGPEDRLVRLPVTSTPPPEGQRPKADPLVHQLRTRGYDASLVRVLRDGDTWYRVLVGHFASAQQATETMQRLRDREGVAHAFVASE